MNARQLERANKAHGDYLVLMARRKGLVDPAPRKLPKEGPKVKPRWPVGSSAWVPKAKSEGIIQEATQDVLGDYTYLVQYWGDGKPETETLEEHQLEDLVL
jgi:hypothetical protein